MMWIVYFIGFMLFSLLVGAIWLVLYIDWVERPKPLPRAQVFGRLLGLDTRWKR